MSKSTFKERDDKIQYLEKKYRIIMVRLKEEIAGKEKISNEHKRTISDLKRKYGKQLDQTLKDENDRLNKESTTQAKYIVQSILP